MIDIEQKIANFFLGLSFYENKSVSTMSVLEFLGSVLEDVRLNNRLTNTNNDEMELNEWEIKAVKVIEIVDGLSQTQINHIFSLVNHSISQSPNKIQFQKRKDVYQNADLLNGGRNNFKQDL